MWTAPWYVQPSFPVLYRKDVLAKAGVAVPRTWSALLKACDALNAKGITPMAGGVKDGWFGGWLFAIIGAQGIGSISDVLDATTGKTKFTNPKLAAYWTRLQELRDHKCWNDDINSQDIYTARRPWSQGKAAMTVSGGSDVKKFVKKVGVAKARRDGHAQVGQWSVRRQARLDLADRRDHGLDEEPRVSLDFIMFMHTPERMAAWFKATGAFPADNRFNTKLISLPQQKVLFGLVKNGSPYLENFIPAGARREGLLRTGQASARRQAPMQAQAAAATEKAAQRIRLTQRKQMADFKKWSASYK